MAVSLTMNQRAARLDGKKKSIHLRESETNISSAIISFGQRSIPHNVRSFLEVEHCTEAVWYYRNNTVVF